MIRARHAIPWAFCAAFGCSQVLGIDEAFVEPSLEGGLGGAPASGGSGADRALGGATSGGSVALGNTNDGVAGGAGGAVEMGGAGGASEAAGAGGAASAVDVCESQCDLIEQFCVGDALQYRDTEQCLRICRALPRGALDDDRVNTASCRLRYAAKVRYLAGPELAATCRYAGPGGDGRCGSNCEGLCALTMAACSPELSDPYFYRSIGECLLDCEGLPESGYVYGTVAAGNALECRLFHASSAMMGDADEHCEHALGATLCTELDRP